MNRRENETVWVFDQSRGCYTRRAMSEFVNGEEYVVPVHLEDGLVEVKVLFTSFKPVSDRELFLPVRRVDTVDMLTHLEN